MGKNQRRFTPEFKREAVELAEGAETIAEVARDLGIAENTLYKWRAQLTHEPSQTTSKRSRKTHKDEEIRRLERENAKLRAERDFLKKAAAFFVTVE